MITHAAAAPTQPARHRLLRTTTWPRGRCHPIVAVFIACKRRMPPCLDHDPVRHRDAGFNVIWAGIALGVAAGLEVPALFLIGRLGLRFSNLD